MTYRVEILVLGEWMVAKAGLTLEAARRVRAKLLSDGAATAVVITEELDRPSP